MVEAGGSCALSPQPGAFQVFTRNDAMTRFAGVRLNCVRSKLFRRRLGVRFLPSLMSSTRSWLYSPSALSENQARPLTTGPETPNRGAHVPRCGPDRMSIPGTKLVAV